MALFRFGDDDIFGQMDRMMNQMMGGMNMFHNDPFSMTPFGMRPATQSPFPGIANMMSMMQQSANMTSNPGTFVQQSFVSYSADGVNPPQVVEQTHMNRVGPGGVREERRTLRDSRSGVQQMSIGRHIHDRGHVMERSKNRYTGEEEQNDEYINIEEDEAPQFNNEWNTRMASASSGNHRNHRYIQAPARREPMLAIAGPEELRHTPSPIASTSDGSRTDKKLRIKPISMKKEKNQRNHIKITKNK